MHQSQQIVLITPPDRVHAAADYGLTLAHLAYRMGNGPHLFRVSTSALPRGGLMVIGDDGYDGQGDAQSFCREVLRECGTRGFGGIVLDLDLPPTPTLLRIIQLLSEHCKRQGFTLYLPEAFGDYSDSACILFTCAISGGTLDARLRTATERYGAKRVVLCINRSAEDFYLPASGGGGHSLSRTQLQAQMQALSPSVFFSNELCAHYFTYMSPESGAHFVLFDDVGSLRRKMKLAEQLGISRFFLVYTELDDLLPELFPRQYP